MFHATVRQNEIVARLAKADQLPRISDQWVPPEAKDLMLLLNDFAVLTVTLVTLDLERYAQVPADNENKIQWEPISRPYLHQLYKILNFEENLLFIQLQKLDDFSPPHFVAALESDMIEQPSCLLSKISSLSDCVIELLPQKPSLTRTFIPILHCTLATVLLGAKSKAAPTIAVSKIASMNEFALCTCTKASDAVEKAVSKQFQWLTVDNSAEVFFMIENTYVVLAQQDEALAKRLFSKAELQDFGCNLDVAPEIIGLAWKFRMLKHCMTSGRMELRVYGLETIQTDIERIWRQYSPLLGSGNIQPPLIRYLVWFIRQHKLIEYLVGADSHLQLINRSARLIQFLVLNDAYADNDLDTMWRSITDNQGARLVTEVLNVLSSNFHLFSLNQVLRICEKLMDLEISRFDSRVEVFSYDATQALLTKLRSANRALDPLPLRLALRIFRDAKISSGLSMEDVTRLRRLAHHHLQLTISYGIQPVDEERFIRECVADLESRNNSAVSSVWALHVLILNDTKHYAPKLAADYNLTGLLITTLLRHLDMFRSEGEVGFIFQEDLWKLLLTLGHIVLECPDFVTPDQIGLLWNEVFLSKTLNKAAQDIAWDWLSRTINEARIPNSFVERLTNDYIPKVQPKDFHRWMLGFVQNTVEYELRGSAPITVSENSAISIPGIERIWRFLLEADADNIGQLAMTFMISTYLDHLYVTQRLSSSVEATHVTLADRCVTQILAAASRLKAFTDGTLSGEDEPMVIIASDEEMRLVERQFGRSLSLLRQFLQGLRSRPHFSPRPSQERRLNVLSTYPSLRGKEVRLRYSTNGGKTAVSNAELVIGSDNTAHELAEYLIALTGFTKINVLSMGQRLFLYENLDKLESLHLSQHPVVVWKALDAEERRGSGSSLRASSAVEAEVLSHFDQLCGLLELEDRHAKEMYGFLIQFPAPCSVQALVGPSSLTTTLKFPTDKPYKFLYVLTVLRTELEHEVFTNPPNEERILQSVQAIASTLGQPWASEADEVVRALIANQVVGCLHLALQAPLSQDISQSLFSEPDVIAKFLLRLTQGIAGCTGKDYYGMMAETLLGKACAVIMEASLHEPRVWQALECTDEVPDLIKKLLLEDERTEMRRALAEAIFSLSGLPSTLQGLKVPPANPLSSRFSPASIQRFLLQLWSIIAQLLPRTVTFPTCSEQLFEVAQATLLHVKELLSEDDIIAACEDWWNIVAKHEYQDVVGHLPSDYVIPGLARLLLEVSQVSHAWDGNINRKHLLKVLFDGPLFPETPIRAQAVTNIPKVPILQSQTRHDLYELVQQLIQDPDELLATFDLILDVHTDDDNFLLFPGGRLLLRSEQGFAGLRNLSNTCYLNSLFTQLFMNLEFREFVINAKITDSRQQVLLYELGQLFASMQDTWRKWADPSLVVDNIETFEGSPIDINIQMDVDEFFNLLFDRLEGQIPRSEDKQRFRSLYGGQLVQQMKSKECPHISERLEPFSAIQCEIKGKTDLEESLRNYVEGEIMQGDNKYLCTSCNRHVDAVKRACLKDVPNNVIFHLKRFDFDMTTMTRCKVNDEFRFPDRIDLTPYKVESLSDPDISRIPDIFELVGVLVHQGTAETGHYYSYIRERPTSKLSNDSWVHYNDADVSDFDYRKINECCFGGQEYPFRTPKINNAYMLFYQRVSSLQSFASTYKHPGGLDPFHLPLPRELGNKIAMENEQFVRDYCVQDTVHATFIRKLLHRAMPLPRESCSELHKLENMALTTTFLYIRDVSSRTRGYPEVEACCHQLIECCSKCARCSDRTLKLMQKAPDKLANMLLYHSERNFRRLIVELVLSCLRSIRSAHSKVAKSAVKAFVSLLGSFWPDLHSWYRASNEYFILLEGILGLGDFATPLLVDDDWLKHCLELIYIQRPYNELIEHPRHWRSYSRLLHHTQNHCKITHPQMLAFFSGFIKCFNLCRPNRDPPNGLVKMNDDEWGLFGPIPRSHGQNMFFVWLDEIIRLEWNRNAVDAIIETLLGQLELTLFVRNTLEFGVYTEDAACFLKPILAFSKACLRPEAIAHCMNIVFGGYEGLGPQENTSILHWELCFSEFVTELVRINTLSSSPVPNSTMMVAMSKVKDWCPYLLLSRTASVRRETLHAIQDLITFHMNNHEPESSVYTHSMEALAHMCEKTLAILNEKHDHSGKLRIFQPVQVEEMEILMQKIKETFLAEEDSGYDLPVKADGKFNGHHRLASAYPEYRSDQCSCPTFGGCSRSRVGW